MQQDMFDYDQDANVSDEYDESIEGDKNYNIGGKQVSGEDLANLVTNMDSSGQLQDEVATLRTELARLQGAMDATQTQAGEGTGEVQEPEPPRSELVEVMSRMREDGEQVDMENLIQILQAQNNDWQRRIDTITSDPQYTEEVMNHHINRLGQAHLTEQDKETAVLERFNQYVTSEANSRNADVEIVRGMYQPILDRVLDSKVHFSADSSEAAAKVIEDELNFQKQYLSSLREQENGLRNQQNEQRSAASSRQGYTMPKPRRGQNGTINFPNEETAMADSKKVYRGQSTIIG